jgi:hypothetical protein
VLALGVEDVDLQRFGDPGDHERLHGLDDPGISARIREFL